MILSAIEKIVLANIGFDRYSALSVDTNTEKIEDFATLHTCVNLAREEIKINTIIPALLKWITATATIAGQKAYSLPTDFDIPVKMLYSEDTEEELTQLYPANLKQKIADTTVQGTPEYYMILGQSSGLVQVEFYSIPLIVGSYKGIYKPILSELSVSTDEDVIMKKYPKTVIDFASAFAFQLIKKDDKNHDKFYQIGLGECVKISLREMSADSSYKELPPISIRNDRSRRTSK